MAMRTPGRISLSGKANSIPLFLSSAHSSERSLLGFSPRFFLRTGETHLEADPQFYGVPHSIPSEGSLQKDFMGD